MNALITPANFEFFARYLLAGFLIISIRSRFVIGERPKVSEALVEAVILSLINQLVFTVAITIVDLVHSVSGVPERLLFFIEVLATPTAIGLLLGWNLARGWNGALLRRLAMPVQNPVRRAYDHAISVTPTERFVIPTFADGTKVYGLYGENSLAATDAARSDIFLERLYDVAADGQWFEQIPARSALIVLEGLRSLEFLEPEGPKDV